MSGVVFTRDGRTALVTRNNDSLISVLTIAGTKVENAKRDIAANLKPYGIEVTPAGDVGDRREHRRRRDGRRRYAQRDRPRREPAAHGESHRVGPTAEGLAISPDGRYVAVTVMNGSNAAKTSPLFNDYGWLRIYTLNRAALALVAETQIGHWCQGVAWSADSRTVLAQCAVEKEIRTFSFDGRRLVRRRANQGPMGGPSGIRTVAEVSSQLAALGSRLSNIPFKRALSTKASCLSSLSAESRSYNPRPHVVRRKPQHHRARYPEQDRRAERRADLVGQLRVAKVDHCPADERQHQRLRHSAGDDHLHWRSQEPVEGHRHDRQHHDETLPPAQPAGRILSRVASRRFAPRRRTAARARPSRRRPFRRA